MNVTTVEAVSTSASIADDSNAIEPARIQAEILRATKAIATDERSPAHESSQLGVARHVSWLFVGRNPHAISCGSPEIEGTTLPHFYSAFETTAPKHWD
jgi:hypothetical protein